MSAFPCPWPHKIKNNISHFEALILTVQSIVLWVTAYISWQSNPYIGCTEVKTAKICKYRNGIQMSVSTCASQRAAFPCRPPASISSVFSPSCGGAERYCSFSPPKGAGHACRGVTRRSAHRLPFAKQTQHLHKWRQIVIPVVAKVSRMLQQLQSEKERIWWMILTIEVVRWIMLKLKKHQHTAESWQTLDKQVFNRWGL